MTIEIVKKELDKLLGYSRSPDFLAENCYHMAYGAVMMASNIAMELDDFKLSMAIDHLWDDTYRELFLQAYREELARQ
jgi:hypothetical protein